MTFIPLLPKFDSAFDLATISSVGVLLLLSLLSLTFIFHLRLKSRTSTHLENFNSLWTVRFLLVSFISLWALNELLRVPFFQKNYIYPFFPSISLSQHTNLCKSQVVLSLGFLEPGFLVTLLFLVGVSVKKRKPNDVWAFVVVVSACFPILLLQIFFTFFNPFRVPEIFSRSIFLRRDSFGNETILCVYPLFSMILFGAFGFLYSLWFLISCWRALALVINKALRVRIYALAGAVLGAGLAQIVFLGLSMLLRPDQTGYGAVTLVAFLSTLTCAAVGEGILVIRPIADALAAGDCCRWINSRRQPVGEEGL